MMVTKHKETTLENFGVEIPNKQEVSKNVQLLQEVDKNLDDLVHYTSSPEEFKNKYGENLGEFDKRVILLSIILKNLEKVPEAERDEELKKLLPSLQEKMKVINENIEKIAKELGYTVSYYSLDKLSGDLDEVKKKLDSDFGGKQLELGDLFSEKALDILTDLFAFVVNKYYPIGSVNASVATVPIISDTEDNKQKSAEEKFAQQVVLQQQAEQAIVKQQPEAKQKEEYHSPFRKAGMAITLGGVALGVAGGLLFAGSLISLPLMGWGLFGMVLAGFGGFIVPLGVVTWAAGLIGEAWHNHHVQKAQEEEEKRKKALEKKEKKRIEKEEKRKKAERIKRDEEASENKDQVKEASENKDQVIKNDQSALESPHEDIGREEFSIFNLAYKLVPKLESPNEDTRREAWSIVEHGLKSQDPEIRNGALSMLEVALESPYRDVSMGSMYLLGEALKSQDPDVREGAITILGKALKSQNEGVRTEALWLLKDAIKSLYEDVRKGVLPLLKDTFESPSYPVGAFLSCVGAALESINPEVRMTAMSLVKENLKSEDPNKRRAATTLLDLALEHNPYTDVRNEAINIKMHMQ